MNKQILTTPSGETYPILTGSGLLHTCGAEIAALTVPCRAVIVSDSHTSASPRRGWLVSWSVISLMRLVPSRTVIL